MRHRGGHSSIGFELGKLLFSEVLKSTYKQQWRIGNDINRCVLCGKCEKVCHVDALTVSRHNGTWTLNNRRCVKCLQCVVACPARCLTQVGL